MQVADVGRSRSEAARWSMQVADVVEVGRWMSRFLKYIGLTGGIDVVASPYSASYVD